MDIRGEVTITVRDSEGRVKDKSTSPNTVFDKVRQGLMAEIVGEADAYSIKDIPTRFLFYMNNGAGSEFYDIENRTIGGRGQVTDAEGELVGYEMPISFSTTGITVGSFQGSTTINVLYLLSAHEIVAHTSPAPNPEFTAGDSLDIDYKLIIRSRNTSTSEEFFTRLLATIRGGQDDDGVWQVESKNLKISRAELNEAAGPTLSATDFSLSYGGLSATANIRFDTVTGGTPNLVSYYIVDPDDKYVLVQEESVTVEDFASGFNVIVPLTVSF
jgi:hypothetical protein